ncbi:hypothetical protein RABR111495_22775 [Rahnella bruchi]
MVKRARFYAQLDKYRNYFAERDGSVQTLMFEPANASNTGIAFGNALRVDPFIHSANSVLASHKCCK